MATCSDCLCYYCLYYWSERCPYRGCYDDYRAQEDPYTDHFWKGICGQTVISQESRHTGAGAATYIRQKNAHISNSMKGRK